MSKIVIVIFQDDQKAQEGARALKQLNDEGSISTYATALIEKGVNGKVTEKELEGKGKKGLVLGALLGGLVGLIGGPAVAAVGAAGGALMGGWRDVLDLGVGFDFVDEVAKRLKPGDTAIVAEVDEDWVTPLDSRMDVRWCGASRPAR